MEQQCLSEAGPLAVHFLQLPETNSWSQGARHPNPPRIRAENSIIIESMLLSFLMSWEFKGPSPAQPPQRHAAPSQEASPGTTRDFVRVFPGEGWHCGVDPLNLHGFKSHYLRLTAVFGVCREYVFGSHSHDGSMWLVDVPTNLPFKNQPNSWIGKIYRHQWIRHGIRNDIGFSGGIQGSY